MSKKSFALVLILALTVSAFLPLNAYSQNTFIVIPNLNTITYAKAGEPESIDPAWAYDSASAEMIQNIYDPLITLPREQVPSDPLMFKPAIASSWTISPDGMTYTFKINTSIKFHDGTTVTPEDVEYSFQRGMVLDHISGPQWQLYYPLTGIYSSSQIDLTDQAQVHSLGVDIDSAITLPHSTVSERPDGDGLYRAWTPTQSIITLRPDADATFNGWAGTSQDWDDVTPDGDNTYVSAATYGLWELSNLTNPSPQPHTVIEKVRMVTVARQTTGDETMLHLIIVGGSGEPGSAFTPTTDYQPYTSEWSTNPNTGSAWAWSDIDGLQAGVRSDQNGASWDGELRVTQLYVEVITARYSLWDDGSPDGDATYLSANANNLNETSTLANPVPSTNWKIVNVKEVVAARQTNGDEKARLMLVIGGKGHNGSLVTPVNASSYISYSSDWSFNPATGSAWTWSDINNLQAGVRSQQNGATWTGEIRVTQLYIEVEFAINSDTLIFNLKFPYAPFMQILTGTIGSVLSKPWALTLLAAGREIWDGDWTKIKAGWTLDHTEWVDHNDNILGLWSAPLDTDGAGNFVPVEMGTGPFTLGAWMVGGSYTLNSFGSYWQGWPAPGCARGITSVNVNFVYSWPTRKLIFLSKAPASQADLVDVPTPYISEVVNEPGVRHCKYLPTLRLDQAGCFNFQVAPTSSFFGVKPTLLGATKLDLFSDIHVRKGFAYAFNYAQYIIDMYRGEAEVPSSPILRGMPFFNASKPEYARYLSEAKYHFKMAYGGVDHNPPGQHNPDLVDAGNLWNHGFTTPLPYNIGSIARQHLLEMLKHAIEVEITGWGVAPSLTIFALPWATYVPAMLNGELPYWLTGYVGESTDPASTVHAFWHSTGGVSKLQKIDWSQIADSDYHPTSGRHLPYTNWEGKYVPAINNTYIDELVEKGQQLEIPPARQLVYEELADAWYAEMPTMPVAQPLMRHWERDWVQGWYYNPLRPGYCFYEMWKGLDADMNGDQRVDMSDVGLLNAHWHDPPYYIGDYSIQADINYPGRWWYEQTREMDGANYILLGSDGKVNLADLGLVRAQFGDSY